MKHSRGFTLVELAVVLGVIGVLAALAGPNLLTMRDNFRNKDVTTDVSSMLRQARGIAMQENINVALVVRTGSTSIATDDRVALVRCPSGTSLATPALTNITSDMIDGITAFPSGFSLVKKAELGSGSVGIQPGSAGILTIAQRPYNTVPRTTGCSFCTSGKGEIVFSSDGQLHLTLNPGPDGVSSGSITVSQFAGWPTPASTQMYTITIFRITGEVRVWH